MLSAFLTCLGLAVLCLAMILAPAIGRLLTAASLPMRSFASYVLVTAVALAAMLVAPVFAFADDGTVSGTAINLNSIVETVIGLAAVALAAAGHIAVSALKGFLQNKTGIDLDSAVRNYLDPAIDKAVAYGQLRATQLVANNATIDVHNVTIAHAANYLLTMVPDALSHFGISDTTLKQMIEARLSSWLGVSIDPPASVPTADPAASTTAVTQ